MEVRTDSSGLLLVALTLCLFFRTTPVKQSTTELGILWAPFIFVTKSEQELRLLDVAAILASLHMQTADDLFGGPQGSPRTDKLIAASIQWAEKIMEKIDDVLGNSSGR